MDLGEEREKITIEVPDTKPVPIKEPTREPAPEREKVEVGE